MIRPTTSSNPSQLSTLPRSTTSPAKPAHKHQVPHHPHRVHHHPDKSVPQSATLPTTSKPFGDLLSKTTNRTDGRVDGNKTPPRGPELPQSSRRVNDLKKTEREEESESEKERDRETWREVDRLRVRRKAADDDLRIRLTTLSTLSTTTTRRLDYTYYSLLSSMSSLTSAVSSLSSLSTQTSTLQAHFTSSSSSLTSEVTAQVISSNKSSDAQARRISQLNQRIKEGRDKVGRLGERLDGVREKVERSSLRDRESRRIIGRRWKILWGSLGFLVGLFLILAATRQWRRNGDMMEELVHLGNQTEGVFEEAVGRGRGRWEQGRERQRDDESWRPGAKTSMRVKDTTARTSTVDVDATLRLFDQL